MNRIECNWRLGPQRSRLPKLFSLVVIAAVAAAEISAMASVLAKEDPSRVELNGIVTDAACGATHGTKTHGDAECTRICARLGAGYALAVGKKIYVLTGHGSELNHFAGARVSVKGKMVGREILSVESVVPWALQATYERKTVRHW